MQYDPGRFKDYFEHQMTYAAGFRRNVARYGSATALIDPPSGRTRSEERRVGKECPV